MSYGVNEPLDSAELLRYGQKGMSYLIDQSFEDVRTDDGRQYLLFYNGKWITYDMASYV
uniref:Aspartate aminotransferase family protein n=1 Tax=Heterorhabditis bacteriophora TaxID=37862 RepID=A0A1I7X6U1_HETBA